MALRALIEDGSTRIRETTLAEHNAMLSRITYLYQQGTVPVELSYVTSGGNITPNMTDTRYKSGAAISGYASSFPPESSTQEPQLVTGTTWDRISQTVTTPATLDDPAYQTLATKPVYRDTSNSLREMSYTQVLQYFIDPVVNAMRATNLPGTHGAGSYYISTAASISGSTNMGIVFQDTTADASAYDKTAIGATGTYQDHFDTTTYYLYRANSSMSSQGSGYRTPLMIDYSQSSRSSQTPRGLRHMTYAEFDALFGPLLKYAVHSVPGYRLRYNINGNGTRKGTAIMNRQMLGSSVTGDYQQYEATIDDYRAQEFPNGTIVTVNQFDLNLDRT